MNDASAEVRRVLVLGEALIDLSPDHEGRFLACPGGGPMNTAVGLARLGMHAALVSGIPSGAFGDLIRAHLSASGVDTSMLRTSALPSTLAIVESPIDPTFALYTAGTAAFDLGSGALPPVGSDVAVIHTASLALFVQPSADTTLQIVEREAGRRVISIDPNIRPASGPRDAVRTRFERLCKCADIVRLSSADHDWLYPGASRADSVRHLLGLGPALVALTLGSEGAIAATRMSSAYRRPAASVVVDTVGAGDAFNAAILARCLMRGQGSRRDLDSLTNTDLQQMLDWASAAAAINCSRTGADPAWNHELV